MSAVRRGLPESQPRNRPRVPSTSTAKTTATSRMLPIDCRANVAAPYSVGLAQFFREPFLAGGGEVVSEQKYTGGDKDFRAQLTAIRAANVDGVYVPGFYTEAALICKQARELGLAVPLLGVDGWESPELIQIGGAAVGRLRQRINPFVYKLEADFSAFGLPSSLPR